MALQFIRPDKVPSPRYGVCAATFSDHAIIFGGFEANTSMPCDDLLKFSIKTSTWELIVKLAIFVLIFDNISGPPRTSKFPTSTLSSFFCSVQFTYDNVKYYFYLVSYTFSFGGIGADGKWLNDTWSFDLTNLPVDSVVLKQF